MHNISSQSGSSLLKLCSHHPVRSIAILSIGLLYTCTALTVAAQPPPPRAAALRPQVRGRRGCGPGAARLGPAVRGADLGPHPTGHHLQLLAQELLLLQPVLPLAGYLAEFRDYFVDISFLFTKNNMSINTTINTINISFDLISPQQVCTQGSQSHDYRVEDGHEARGEHKPHQHHLTLGTL